MKQYNFPKTEIFDLRSENLMIGGMSLASGDGGNGNGHADAPARRSLIPE